MENEVSIASTTETDLGWEFEVNLDGHQYIVTLTSDYYYQLTGSNITPQELVERAFEFLLVREPASSILPEFDIKLINEFYPEFDSEIMKQ